MGEEIPIKWLQFEKSINDQVLQKTCVLELDEVSLYIFNSNIVFWILTLNWIRGVPWYPKFDFSALAF